MATNINACARTTVLVGALAALPVALAGPIGPTGYTSFSLGSPFAGVDYSAGYFHLENFEDGLFNTPGVAPVGQITGPGGITDSVDEDDGSVDGSGQQGRSLFGSGATGFTFSFNAGTLGALPTHAGVVWTDGAAFNTVVFRAFGPGNVLLGELSGANIGDGNFNSGTAEDRFFGWTDAGGISSIRIFNSVMTGGGSGIEVDHLQYGRAQARPLPEPGPLGLLGAALLGLISTRRRQR